MKVTLFGASGGEVTGSCYHLQTDRANIFIDCGLFQGAKKLENQNRIPKRSAVQKLDAVVLEDQQVMFRVLTGLWKRLVLEQWLDELEHSAVGLGAPLERQRNIEGLPRRHRKRDPDQSIPEWIGASAG